MRDSSPMLQALTLSTNLTKPDKLKSKTLTGSNLPESDQSFRSKTLQSIKASHQSKSGTGVHTGRQAVLGNGKSSLPSPPGVAATGRLRDNNARSESKLLQDAGLRVSAVKVSQRQPMEVSQGANVHSPYSTKDPDGKAVMKRKGLVRSATFTAGSTDASDSSPLNADMIGRLGYRGSRPGSAPAAGDNHAPSIDSHKQPSKRRQLAEVSDPSIAPFALPSFRPSNCLTADQLGRSRHGQRPGTPNVKPDSLTGVSSSSSTGAHSRRNLKVPAAFTKSAEPASQDWPISRWVSGRTPSITSTASVAAAVHALHAGRGPGATELLNSERADEEPSFSRSSSDTSSIAASSGDDTHRSQTSRSWVPDPPQTIVRVRKSTLQRPQPIKSSATSADAVSASQSSGCVEQGVSSLALSHALKSLGSKPTKHSEMTSSQHQDGAASHMNGNTVVSCVSTHDTEAIPSDDVDRSTAAYTAHDPLLRESNQVMQWFGMSETWFEEDFLPYAMRAMWLAHHHE